MGEKMCQQPSKGFLTFSRGDQFLKLPFEHMASPEVDTPVRLRRGAGVFLAVQWNLPILLLFWYPWSVFHLVMVGNCFLWSAGCYLTGRFPRCRALLFRPSQEGEPPRWRAAAVWMAVLGSATLLAWFFERR